MFKLMILRKRVRDEPSSDFIGVANSGLTDAQKGPNVGAMLFDGSPIPIVGRIEVDRDIELVGNKGNGRNGHIVFLPWEATVDLKILEQQCEAQAIGALLVFKERHLARQESPVGHQVVVGPEPFSYSDTPLSAQESSRRDCFVDNRLTEEYRSEATSSDGSSASWRL